jgi:hypothetical protein
MSDDGLPAALKNIELPGTHARISFDSTAIGFIGKMVVKKQQNETVACSQLELDSFNSSESSAF